MAPSTRGGGVKCVSSTRGGVSKTKGEQSEVGKSTTLHLTCCTELSGASAQLLATLWLDDLGAPMIPEKMEWGQNDSNHDSMVWI